MKTTKPLTIGALATQANVNKETIRYYQKQGLIIEPKKPLNGFRHYPSSAILRLQFIKRAQQLGFSLKEIKQLLSLGEKNCQDVQQIAKAKRNKIEQQIKSLQLITRVLDDMIKQCDNNNNSDDCRLISALSKQGFLDNNPTS